MRAILMSAVCDCGISWSYSLTISNRSPYIFVLSQKEKHGVFKIHAFF